MKQIEASFQTLRNQTDRVNAMVAQNPHKETSIIIVTGTTFTPV